MERKEDENPTWGVDQAINTSPEVEDYIQARIEDYKEDSMNGENYLICGKETS
jgi:hypothetical protein